ncbi:hypothetical protein KDN32_07270 [Nocardioides sp. J2M5]|uniref:hypothetical protein n=1 Tax=Nocardioides palaemonis TaxID=2829810 RepID=UPI001BA4A182|nr:hypothetical protein [Nocardioides palaemonis]MBS2937538.1 hypothetical protein [Nocardioides palaemonis]
MLLAGLGAGAVVLGRDGRHDVRPGTVEAPRASPAAAAAALADVAAALRDRDTGALVALAPPDDEAARTALEGVGRNVRSLAVRDVAVRYVDQAGTVAADGSWTAVAEVDWRLGDQDAATSTAEVLVGLVPDGAGLAVSGFLAPAGDRTARLPLWLRGRLSVARSGRVLVLADGPQRVADTVARRATVGIGVVRRVLPDWTGPVVVEVPATAADLDEALGAAPGTYAGIAAVTTAAGSGTDATAPVHVFVNPEVTSGLRRAGAQVVMSHELVHVATDATRTPMETWLLEGFADWVALRDVDLPDSTTLGRAIRSARADGVPDRLPAAADFDPRANDLQARYEQAWLACRVVADALGEQGLVRLYDAAAGGEPVDRALARAGLPLPRLTALWRSALADLAG